ncbi:MAG: hypothetical protein WAW92_04320 [Minisyncoccia bacterium]
MKQLNPEKTKITSEGFSSERDQGIFSTKNAFVFSSIRIFIVSLVSFVVLLSLASVGGTVSYFQDTEQSLANYFRADPISFKLTVSQHQVDLSSENKVELVMTPDATSDPIQYYISAKIISGDDVFCGSIDLVGTWPFPISGKFLPLLTETTTITGSWTTTLSVPEENKIADSSCLVEITYFGWSADAPLGRSYTDTQKVLIQFFIPSNFVSMNIVEPMLLRSVSEDKSEGNDVVVEEVINKVAEEIDENSTENVEPTPTPAEETIPPAEEVGIVNETELESKESPQKETPEEMDEIPPSVETIKIE